MLNERARSHLSLLTDYPTRNSHDSTVLQCSIILCTRLPAFRKSKEIGSIEHEYSNLADREYNFG
jgi:hypothetical protein